MPDSTKPVIEVSYHADEMKDGTRGCYKAQLQGTGIYEMYKTRDKTIDELLHSLTIFQKSGKLQDYEIVDV